MLYKNSPFVQSQTTGLKPIRHGGGHKKIKSHKIKCLFIVFYCVYLFISSGFLHCVVCFVCPDVSETRTSSFRVTDLLQVDADANG
jgi:hypothetical protein